MLGIIVLQAEQMFSLDDKANDWLLHPADGNCITTINLKTTFLHTRYSCFFSYSIFKDAYPKSPQKYSKIFIRKFPE